ncbi:hypothetical protein HY229_04660 [Candidatus Acetothermia bacterium]|nr:hypothetical protein [Candidatus Acetothermia bacterium]MBI3643377.1 hypothetical protein [Candidatus Acetothermia bacterium]
MYDQNFESVANAKFSEQIRHAERKYQYSLATHSHRSMTDLFVLILGNSLVDLGRSLVTTVQKRS